MFSLPSLSLLPPCVSFVSAKLSYSSPVYPANLFTITFEMTSDHHLKQIQNSTSYRLCSLPLYSSQKVEKFTLKIGNILMCFGVWNLPSITLVNVVTPKERDTQCS